MSEHEASVARPTHRASAAETRARILNTAIELIALRSIHQVQLRDVAAAAGVSSALAVRYFKSKEDLFLEAMFARWETIGVPFMIAWLEANPNPTVRDVALAVLRRDTSLRRTTRDFMSMSYWWSLEDEARYIECLEPRRVAFERALMLQSGLAADAPELVAVINLIRFALPSIVREATVQDRSAEQATDQFMAAMAPAFRSIGISN
jgi:AcrR family transcriptional regulator